MCVLRQMLIAHLSQTLLDDYRIIPSSVLPNSSPRQCTSYPTTCKFLLVLLVTFHKLMTFNATTTWIQLPVPIKLLEMLLLPIQPLERHSSCSTHTEFWHNLLLLLSRNHSQLLHISLAASSQ